MVDLLLTIEACISHWALTEVAPFRVVDTMSAVEARPICTGTGAQLTVAPIEAWWTGALVAVVIILYWEKCTHWLHCGLLARYSFIKIHI